MPVYEGLNDSQQFACRVIADHARSTAFAIADGILPGNEGRNYVLRKIMRRAIYHGREHLGLLDPFFYKVCDLVVSEMRGAYPELETQRDFIGKMVRIEEERFGNTVTVGLGKLNELRISEGDGSDKLFLDIAKLYDTFGTPRDLIRVFLEEKGIEFGEDEYDQKFDHALQELQQQSDVGHTTRRSQVSPVYKEVLKKVGPNRFHGYDVNEIGDSTVLAILHGDRETEKLSLGEDGGVILSDTPFYAEAGGQVGDIGFLHGIDQNALVTDTYSPISGLIIHKVKMRVGS
ncbi:MAG: alanine--tRNA ligase-related protein, partial [Pyrinomonadaceae bacterium]